jgi:hypothetical protein
MPLDAYLATDRIENTDLARTEDRRNYAACLSGYGYCDRAQLTPAELRSLPPVPASAR